MAEARYAESDGGVQLIPGYRHRLTSQGIGEWNLWGQLREVVVGTAKGTVIPRYEPMYEEYLGEEVVAITKDHGGELVEDALPELFEAFERESDELARIYESHGVKVHRPREIRPEELAYSFGFGANNLFPCDPFWCVGRNIIETSWRKMSGWPAKWAIRDTYQAKVDVDPATIVHSCPLPSPGPQGGDYFFEVGDILIVGDGNVIVAYGEDETSSNLRGCEWAKRALEADGFKVTILKLPQTEILHLYAVICIVGPKTAIAFEDAFPGRVLPEPLKDFDVVWCDIEEARAAAPCAVNIDRHTVLLPSEAPKTRAAIEGLGFDVVHLPFATHAALGGGIRCATGVIYREID
jgi:N-dimethylarginine dimethylaminohydrolase